LPMNCLKSNIHQTGEEFSVRFFIRTFFLT
jgi:hypothetical protein